MLSLIGKHRKLLVLFFLVLGASLRLFYMAYPLNKSSEVTVDEAVYGIQSIRIMNGDRPVFYPAQDYTGSFSAYLSALVFYFFGVSSWGLKLVPFLFSVGTIWLTYRLALKIFNRKVAAFTLLISALGTPFWNNWSSRAGTGYVEATFTGVLILLLVTDLVRIEGNLKKRITYFLVMGLLSGLGFWMQPTIVYFIVPSLIFLFLNLKRKFFLPFVFFCFAFTIGAFPVFYYNLFIKPSGTTGALFKKPWGVRGALLKIVLEGFPVLLGGRTSNSIRNFNFITSSFIYLFFVFSLGYLLKIVFRLRGLKNPEFLIVLTFFSTLTIFLLSAPFNQLAVEPRYVFSLCAILPIIMGLFMERVVRFKFPLSFLMITMFILNWVLGLRTAGPLTFLDSYNFKPLVSFLLSQRVGYVISTPSLGHRIIFFSGGRVKASIRGGGITEVRFERINEEVTKARDIDPRLVAYVCLKNEPELSGFQIEASSQFGQSYSKKIIGNNYAVIYSNSSVLAPTL